MGLPSNCKNDGGPQFLCPAKIRASKRKAAQGQTGNGLFVSTLKEDGSNKYQLIVDQALSRFQPSLLSQPNCNTPNNIRNRQRSDTPLSSIEVLDNTGEMQNEQEADKSSTGV